MIKIKDLFTKHMGTDLELNRQTQVPYTDPDATRYVSRTAKNNGVTTYIKKIDKMPSPGHVLSVACGGSVLSTFYQDKPFYSGRDLYYLQPKQKLSVKEMLFYAMVISQNKYKFNYGRQANRTLEDLVIPAPSEIPSWVYEMDIPTLDDISETKSQEKVELPPINQWKTYTYQDLFTIQKVTGPKISEVKKTEGNVPYVSATSENNGIACYGDFQPTTKKNCLTVGHLGDCFYQNQNFAGSNVTVLIPKFELNQTLGLFLATLINANKYKYCYGRVIGIGRLKEETISLPVTSNGEPDWDLMERYINSLPYSKYL